MVCRLTSDGCAVSVTKQLIRCVIVLSAINLLLQQPVKGVLRDANNCAEGTTFSVLAEAFSPRISNIIHAPASLGRTTTKVFFQPLVRHPYPIATSIAAGAESATNELGREPSVESNKSSKKRVIVIGAGVGGLAAAARIQSSSEDVEVLVLEKNSRKQLGGRCGSFDVVIKGAGTFRHERGPSLLLLKEEYERLFEDCGRKIAGNSSGESAAERYGLRIKQCLPAYQVVFDDGDTVNLGFPSSCGNSTLKQESINKLNSFESDGSSKWEEYLQTCAAFLDCGLPNFIEEKLDLASFPNFLWESLRDGAKRWPLQPHSTMLDSLFASPKMCALASFQDLYVGLEPYANPNRIGGGVLRKTAPAVFGLLAALELHPDNKRAGVFAPVGGFRQVAESMHKLCLDCGVKFQFDTSVTRVCEEGVHIFSKGEGLSSQEFLSADLIICNADLPFATETIAKPESDDLRLFHEEKYDWDDKFDYSSGVIAFHWSISKSCDALNTHNVFMSAKDRNDAVKSWSVLRYNDPVCDSPTSDDDPFNFYVHRASKTDETAAPSGMDSVMVLVPCSTLVRNPEFASLPRDEAIAGYNQQFNSDTVDRVRKSVFQRLSVLEGLADLESLILDEVVDTPATYADYYNVGAGVPFALSHGLGQLSLTRPGAVQTQKNLLFVGASSRPGNGVPLVLIGARAVANKAIQKITRSI